MASNIGCERRSWLNKINITQHTIWLALEALIPMCNANNLAYSEKFLCHTLGYAMFQETWSILDIVIRYLDCFIWYREIKMVRYAKNGLYLTIQNTKWFAKYWQLNYFWQPSKHSTCYVGVPCCSIPSSSKNFTSTSIWNFYSSCILSLHMLMFDLGSICYISI